MREKIITKREDSKSIIRDIFWLFICLLYLLLP